MLLRAPLALGLASHPALILLALRRLVRVRGRVGVGVKVRVRVVVTVTFWVGVRVVVTVWVGVRVAFRCLALSPRRHLGRGRG